MEQNTFHSVLTLAVSLALSFMLFGTVLNFLNTVKDMQQTEKETLSVLKDIRSINSEMRDTLNYIAYDEDPGYPDAY